MEFEIPEINSTNDTLALIILDNESFKKQAKFNFDGKTHFYNPKILSDFQIDSKINDLADLLDFITAHFYGKVFVLSPLPQFLVGCCFAENPSQKPCPLLLITLNP